VVARVSVALRHSLRGGSEEPAAKLEPIAAPGNGVRTPRMVAGTSTPVGSAAVRHPRHLTKASWGEGRVRPDT
jgi:hypothetical protein